MIQWVGTWEMTHTPTHTRRPVPSPEANDQMRNEHTRGYFVEGLNDTAPHHTYTHQHLSSLMQSGGSMEGRVGRCIGRVEPNTL